MTNIYGIKVAMKVYVNGTLQVLSLVNNTLNGFLPNDISLLSSLEILDLQSHFLKEMIPTEVGTLKKLKVLDVSSN
jgi:Leucine-rich repeat (LRR) protein